MKSAMDGASIVLDGERHDTRVVFKMLHEHVPSVIESEQVYNEICRILAKHEAAHTVFSRNSRVMMANDDFQITGLSQKKVMGVLATAKRFVYETGKIVLLVTR